MSANRSDIEFSSGGDICRAWLYRPEASAGARVPCIVMAHGFGATRDSGLEPFALRFAEAGYAVLLFDYRHFGASDGMPRQVLSVKHQLQDWQAAIDHARTLDGVDSARIALWGSSFSGGHVIAAAAADGKVACVSSQCPMMDGRASSIEVIKSGGLWHAIKLSLHGIYDLLRAAMFASPHLIPIIGPPGTIAAMTTHDAQSGYDAISPSTMINAVAARVTVLLGLYRPGLRASRVSCPVLVQICEKDTVAPAKAAEAAVKRLGTHAEVKRYPVGHFDVYIGEAFERSVTDQCAFFRKHLSA